MTTVEEDACEAACAAMGLTDDDDRYADRALVWEFCERFVAMLADQGFAIRCRESPGV